ncbi:hypothetical protein LINPERHAP2_LOCUS3980 [Linum perenne]
MAGLVWRSLVECKALKLRQRNSSLHWSPQYEPFLEECRLRGDDRSTSDICAQWLGVAPPPRAITGTTVKVSWVKGLLDHLPVEATPEVVTFDARAYTWVLELAFYWLTGVEITYRCTSYHLLGTRWLHPPTAGVGGSSMAV